MAITLTGGSAFLPVYPYDKFYGVKIANQRTSTQHQLTAVNEDLMSPSANPIWTRIRSFVENPDGSVKYYLDKYDGRFKEGGSARADLTGRDGNVMVEIPEYYMRLEWQGGDFYRLYSDYPIPGFFKVPRRVLGKFMASYYTGETIANTAFVHNGVVSNSLLKWSSMTYQGIGLCEESPIARRSVTAGDVTLSMPDFTDIDLAKSCRGGNSDATKDDKHNSLLGMCRTAASRTNFRNWCNAVNDAHGVTDKEHRLHIGLFHIYNELAWLMRCEFRDYDIQNIDSNIWGGSGEIISDWNGLYGYYPFIPNGASLPLGDRTGYVIVNMPDASGVMHPYKCKSYRGVENPIQYIWQLTDDLLIYNNGAQNAEGATSTAYWCDDPTKYATPSDSGPESFASEHGYVAIAELPRVSTDATSSNNYIKQESIAENGLSLPMTLGSGQVCDYYYWGTGSGWYGSFFGGYAHGGAAAGFGYLGAYYRPAATDANIGARLCRN